MRKLSTDFMNCLKSGFLKGITEIVRKDHDLNLEIRDGFINIYYKGNSLLDLKEISPSRYQVYMDRSFKNDLDIPPELTDTKTTEIFLKCLPHLKQNIILHKKGSLEIEYEQMIIRANNYEPRTNTEYFIIDRQYSTPDGRIDMTGIYWPSKKRRKDDEVILCLFEVKFSLGGKVGDVHNQMSRYYDSLKKDVEVIAQDSQDIFRQKLDLGLYDMSADRLTAMKTLRISRDISKYQFILVLVDYNPYSKQLDLKKFQQLDFADQVKIFYCGLGMWHQNLKPLNHLSS